MLEFTRTNNGKPEIVAPASDGPAVSLSHDNRFCIAVAGDGTQGVDVEVVEDRSESDWRALLGPSGETLFDQLARVESMGRAGTRIWSAREAVYKALGGRAVVLSVRARQDEAVLLHAETDEGQQCLVLTLPVTFTLGRERMVALVTEGEIAEEHLAPSDDAESLSRRDYEHALLTLAGFDPDSYTLAADESTGAFVVRWPVTLRDGANLDRSVHFTLYADWMGKVRELAMQPIAAAFGGQLNTGRWGMVTNSSQLTILAEPRLDDVIEARYWVQRAPQQPRSTVDLHFEWRRIRRDGSVERAALGEMRTTWVALVGHGQVRPEEFPEYFQKFIDARTPLEPTVNTGSSALPEPLGALDRGAPLFRRPEGPRRGPELARRVMETSLRESNGVGNIYFSNYYHWQSHLVDRFLYGLAPEAFRAGGSPGELRCVQVRVDHLADAMPFDDIEVVLSLESLHERGMTFGFEYFRVDSDGSRRKLALGEQECIWLESTGGRGPHHAAPVPSAIRDALLENAQ
jgi:acyl-CoA thioesterase FadM